MAMVFVDSSGPALPSFRHLAHSRHSLDKVPGGLPGARNQLGIYFTSGKRGFTSGLTINIYIYIIYNGYNDGLTWLFDGLT
jgi:hypothetical protein